MRDITLKPCPSCGGKAKSRQNIANQWIVQCTNCPTIRSNHGDMPRNFVEIWWNELEVLNG